MLCRPGSCSLSVLLLLVGTAEPQVSGEPSLSAVHWMENRGQWPPEFEYVATLGGALVGVMRDSLVVQRSGPDGGSGEKPVTLCFEGGSPAVEAEGLELEPGLHHFYLGNDPNLWVKNVRSFARVRLSGLYEGIDLELYEEGGAFEYDLIVAPGADLSAVVVRCDGIESLTVEAAEGVTLETETGPVRHVLGRSWQIEADGKESEIIARPRRIDDRRFGFESPARDPTLALVIDPGLLWSTYWGGLGSFEAAENGAVDAHGNLTVLGPVDGPGSFQTETSFQSLSALQDVFVAKFRHADGKLIYSCRIGGTDRDEGTSVAVDDAGRATVVGWAFQISTNFPTTPGSFDPVKQLVSSAFVLRLSPLADDLEYSTFLEGSSGGTMAMGVAVAASGSAIVTGFTSSSAFPTTAGAFDTTKDSSDDGFVTRLDPTGSFLEWSTFLGGDGGDLPFDLEIDSQETVFVAGLTGSKTFPTTPAAFQRQSTPLGDAFVSRLAADGSDLLWSTYLGGGVTDWAQAIALVPNGDVVVTGMTGSADFPTTPGVFQETKAALDDIFVTRVHSSGSRLVYSTFLGGSGSEFAEGLAVDASGVVTVSGLSGIDFPITPGAFDEHSMFGDVLVAVLDPTLNRLFYATYLGEDSTSEFPHGIAASNTGRITALGQTRGPFPTTPDALFPNFNGSIECFITTLDPYLTGVRSQGMSAPSCLGPVIANAIEMPTSGGSFGLYCSQAPPSAQGYLVVQPTGPGGEVIPGALAWLRSVRSDVAGYLETSLGNLPLSKGLLFRCRFAFLNPPTCSTGQLFSWSNALAIEVQ